MTGQTNKKNQNVTNRTQACFGESAKPQYFLGDNVLDLCQGTKP